MVADSAAMAVQYGHKTVLCDTLTPLLENTPDEFAIASAFADLTSELYGPDFGSGCFYNTTCLM